MEDRKKGPLKVRKLYLTGGEFLRKISQEISGKPATATDLRKKGSYRHRTKVGTDWNQKTTPILKDA